MCFLVYRKNFSSKMGGRNILYYIMEKVHAAHWSHQYYIVIIAWRLGYHLSIRLVVQTNNNVISLINNNSVARTTLHSTCASRMEHTYTQFFFSGNHIYFIIMLQPLTTAYVQCVYRYKLNALHLYYNFLILEKSNLLVHQLALQWQLTDAFYNNTTLSKNI